MSLTLNPTLAAAQNSQSRNPILEIITGKLTEDIPFLGNRLTSSSSDESKPSLIAHSTGRLEALYAVTGHLYLVYTDTSRQTFSYVDLPLGIYTYPLEGAICELSNGDIGIIYLTATQIVRMVVSPTGQTVEAAALVDTFSSGTITSPFVIRMANGTYLLVYAFNNSGSYEIDKRTSSNFLSWSSATDITPSGLVAANWKERPSLLQITTGQIWMFFDYLDGISGDAELVNIYFSTSADNGGTWSAATKLTDYDVYGTGGKHPVAVQRLADTMRLMFYEQSNAVHVDSDFDGFCHSAVSSTGAVSHISLDSVNRKLYCTCSLAGPVGYDVLASVYRLDLATMTIDACWNDTSVPAFSDIFWDLTSGIRENANIGDQHLVPVSHDLVVDLLDGDADTITPFIFKDYPEFSLTQNVDWDPIQSSMEILFCQADHAAQRLYVLLNGGGILIGYFDLTEGGGTKTFNEIVRDTTGYFSLGDTPRALMKVYPSDDLILVSTGGAAYQGWTSLYSLSTGGLYKHYDYSNTAGYPYWGIGKAVLVDGKIYGGFTYESLYGEEDHRGLARIDTATDTVSYFRPPWATLDEYNLFAIDVTDDNRLVVVSYTYGVGIFDLVTQNWESTLYNNTSLPGMDPDGSSPYRYYPILWDADTNMIFVGKCYYVASWNGLIGFSSAGAIMQTKYMDGSYGTPWTWTEPAPLIEGLRDYDAVGAYGGDALYVFWTQTNPDDNTTKIMWDREGSILNLEDYISRQQEIAIEWSVDGSPNRLTFAVSHGHLFDPHNAESLYATYLRKGRKLDVRMGENVSGINYWANQGVFFITEFSLTYERGSYPEARIVAEDRRCFWQHKQILVSDYYTTYPEDILTDILESNLGLESADIDLPVFDDRIELYAQWIETYAKEIIEQICNRFGYFPKFAVDGKFSARKISDSNGVDHTYSDMSRIVNFTPDDKYSNFTNKIIVTGTERSFIEVLFDEEMVGQLSGTIGWWGCKQTHKVYYSPDSSRKCRNPRMKILESATSIGFKLAGNIHESLSDDDPNEKYCTITITAPNLIPQALAFIALVVGAYRIGDAVAHYWTRPVGTFMQMVALTGLNLTLGAIGNFQYEIWARPVGSQRRSIQNDDDHGNDLEHQVEIGDEILQKYEEPLAGSVAELNTVADQKILVERLQRSRVSLTKTAHLQDEVGDTIRVVHPSSGQNMDLFIASLTRRMKMPELGTNDGYFTDSMEAWKI